MATSPISTGTSGTQVKSSKYQLKTEDFIKMMVTQLQNQDPMEPAKNQELLAQMSQIGQLQSSSQLTDTLKSLATQNQIGSASSLIGKTVEGLNDQDDPVDGIVSGVRVQGDDVTLELESGQALKLTRVTSISPATGANATAN